MRGFGIFGIVSGVIGIIADANRANEMTVDEATDWETCYESKQCI